MHNFEVTPWEVKGKVDYEKLIKKFGTKPITPKLLERVKRHTRDLHVLFRRSYFFSHRDFDKILNDYENGKGFFLYTGRGPSGPMHIGHLIPFIATQWLQEKFNVNVYIQITDDEKHYVKNLSMEEIEKWSYENTLDIIAVGFDPERTFIFKNTEYIGNIYPLAVRIAKKINFTLMKDVFGFTNQTNVGLIFFPVLQLIPTFFEHKRCLIPAAIDQDPYWRIQRDLAEKFGYYKAAQLHSKFLPPLTGIEGKMSASRPETAIYLSDDEETIRKKIYKYAFSGGQPTVELHRKLGGNPDIDVSFQWLKILFEPDDKKLKQIEEDYRTGKLLTGELKDLLIERLTEFIKRHKKRREKAKKTYEKFVEKGKLARLMREKIFR